MLDGSTGDAALSVQGITGGYGKARVLDDISFEVPPRTVVALLGANGAGKTTLLSTVAGLLPVWGGRITLAGRDVTGDGVVRRAKAGLSLIPEGRGVFRSLTVRENLTLQVPPWTRNNNIDRAFEEFPVLNKRLRQVVGTMSGGEQQMVAVCRAYLAEPKVILFDEVSMGLAPLVVREMFESIARLATSGVAMVIVEQYVGEVLGIADVAHVMRKGRLVYSGSPRELNVESIADSYLGH